MPVELDIEQPGALTAYLRASGRIAPAEAPRVTVLAGGVSNRTVLVERASGEAWVVKQALARLRVKVEWLSSPERIHREALGLRWLERIAPPGSTTPLVFEDFDHHLLGMAAVPQPHENWKTVLLRGDLDRAHIEQFAHLLGQVHRVSHERRAEIAPVFADRGFFESLRLEPYYVYTAAQIDAARPFIEALLAETRAIQQTLVHGDYSPKNVLVYDNRLILLDHEVIHFGDPGFDLGFSLTHLLSKAHHLPAKRTAFQDAAKHYWITFRQAVTGSDWAESLEARAVRHTLCCLLARVAGKSPLEYLDQSARDRQQAVVVALLADPPQTVAALADRFVAAIALQEN